MEGAVAKFALIIVLMAAQYNLAVSLRSQDVPWVAPPQAQNEMWNPTLFRILSFGHLPVMVDLIWIRAHQDPSYQHVVPGSHPPAYYDFELITDLDPLFTDAYTTGSSIVAVVRNDGPGARDLLLKGQKFRVEELSKQSGDYRARYWSREWEVPLLLAYVYLFELGDLPTASGYFIEAARTAGSPSYLASLSQRLQAPGGQFDVGYRLLTQNIESARDPRVRREWERKRDSLVVVKFLTERREDFARFLAASHRQPNEASLRDFLAARRLLPRDPWGGQLTLDAQNRITTTTPYEPVLGIQ